MPRECGLTRPNLIAQIFTANKIRLDNRQTFCHTINHGRNNKGIAKDKRPNIYLKWIHR
jgi:hypothetical protein